MPARPLILDDALAFPGGGEKVALTLARAFAADLATVHFDPAAFPPGYFEGVRPLDLNAPGRHPLLSRLSRTLAARLTLAAMPRQSRPLCIFSGSLAPLAHRRVEGPKILYCHTPPRILYDQRDFYLARKHGLPRLLYRLSLALYQRAYEPAARAMSAIAANSENVRRRLLHYLGLESRVVHPPCETARFRFIGQDGFYLSTARVDLLKRVEVIVRAFADLPDKRLVVASGGSELDRLRREYGDRPNIAFTGWLGEEALTDLTGRAVATIYIPRDEDFGISPVESMAAGKPVIGVSEGGLVETVLPGRTGLLLPPDPGPEDLARAVSALTPEAALAMREACEQRAKLFDTDVFIRKMKDLADDVTKTK